MKKLEWQRQNRKLHPEKWRKYDTDCKRRANHRRRMKIIELLGGKCVRCGFIDWRALQIDHVNGNGQKDIRAQNSILYYKRVLRRILEGSKDYQLLCANCNWIKRYEKREYVYGKKEI